MRSGMFDALTNFFSTFGQHWIKKLVIVVTDWTSQLECQEFSPECHNEEWFKEEFHLDFYYRASINVKTIVELPFVFFEALGDGDTLQQKWEKSANQLWQYVSQNEKMHFRLIDQVLDENLRFKREIEGFKALSEKMTLMDIKVKKIEEKFNLEIEKLTEKLNTLCKEEEEGTY